jgi:hypothetical protein
VLLFICIGIGNTQGQRPGSYGLTLDHDTVWMYGTSVSLSAASVTYYDVDSKERNIKQNKLSDLYLGDEHFINSPISSLGMDRLQRIVMVNEKYMLTSYFGGSKWVFYVYDRNTKEALVKKVKHDANSKADLKSVDKYILPYFHDCPDAIAFIRKGINKKSYHEPPGVIMDRMFRGISNYDCANPGEGGD